MSALFDPIRKPVLLNGDWFLREDREENGLDFQNGVDGSYRRISVPSDVSVCIPERPYASGVFWYKKTFFAGGISASPRVVLHFEAVNHTAHVYLNGKYIGMNEQGYLPFEFDVTSAVVPDSENELTVRVDTRRRQGQLPTSFYWKNYGGILRDVWLYVTERSYIEDAFVRADADGQALFRVKTNCGEGCELHLCVRDRFGKIAVEKQVSVSDRETSVTQRFAVPCCGLRENRICILPR